MNILLALLLIVYYGIAAIIIASLYWLLHAAIYDTNGSFADGVAFSFVVFLVIEAMMHRKDFLVWDPQVSSKFMHFYGIFAFSVAISAIPGILIGQSLSAGINHDFALGAIFTSLVFWPIGAIAIWIDDNDRRKKKGAERLRDAARRIRQMQEAAPISTPSYEIIPPPKSPRRY